VTTQHSAENPHRKAESRHSHGVGRAALVCYRRSVLGHWAAILVFMGFSAMIAGTLLAASVFLGKGGRQVGRAKSRPFESGVSTGAYEPSRFSISYYLTAMLFIVFDIEIVFLYPLAVQLRQLQLFGFMELLVFVVLLGIGYVYIWRKGALEWK
jgi:NADH-quinone oxidoreductase subunit A